MQPTWDTLAKRARKAILRRTKIRLRDLYDGSLTSNLDGREPALSDFNNEGIVRAFESVLETTSASQRAGQNRPRKRVAVSGLPLFASQVAEAARAYEPSYAVRVMPTDTRLQVLTALVTLYNSDVWYMIGAPKQDRLLKLAARVLRKPQIVHWVGSDILHLRDDRLARQLRGELYAHLAEAKWTQQELRGYGIDAEIAALPVRYIADAPAHSLPKKFTILLYVPRHRSQCYGSAELVQLMNALRGEAIEYLIVGGGELDVPRGVRTENLGWRADLRDAYLRSSVLIRFTERDGLSLMVLEALSFGRHVIWTQPLPSIQRVTSYDDLERSVRAMLAKHKAGRLNLHTSGREFAKSRYSPEQTIHRLSFIWRRAMTRPAEAASRPNNNAEIADAIVPESVGAET